MSPSIPPAPATGMSARRRTLGRSPWRGRTASTFPAIAGVRSRRVISRADHVVALDRANLAKLRGLRPLGSRAALSLLLDHVPGREGEPVADPYYGADEGFDTTWADVTAGARALARRLAGPE